MAITFVGDGAWVVDNASPTTGPSISGSEAVGDRLVCFAAWKDFAITATCRDEISAVAWTEITEFADGSVSTGNGTGSMKVGAWYFDWDGVNTGGPEIVFSTGTGLIAHGASLTFRKGGSETWDTPTFVTAAWPSSASQTINASSTVDVPSGGVVINILGIRDDTSTFSHSVDPLSDSGPTWNGTSVRAPAAFSSTTLGNDDAADIQYRLVTTGAAGVTLDMAATISAAETGASLWVVLGVTAAAAERVPKYQPMTQLLAH
jgi:hypothetical protein